MAKKRKKRAVVLDSTIRKNFSECKCICEEYSYSDFFISGNIYPFFKANDGFHVVGVDYDGNMHDLLCFSGHWDDPFTDALIPVDEEIEKTYRLYFVPIFSGNPINEDDDEIQN